MMKTYQMMGVDQSAARYVETKGNRRHTCEQLGICQCEGLACQPGHVCEGKPQPELTPMDRICYWLGVGMTGAATVFVFCGLTVWLYSL